jgi:transposase
MLARSQRKNEDQQRQIDILRRDLQKLMDAAQRTPKNELDPRQLTFEELSLEAAKECAAATDEEEHEQAEKRGQKKRYKKKHPGRRPIPESLPRKRIVLDIPEDEKTDPITGKALEVVREEVTERVEFIPAHYQVNQYVRPIYLVPNTNDFVMAELPRFALDKLQVDHGFLANIAVRRFVDHNPYYRQATSDLRQGIDFGRNQYDRWMIRIAELLLPLYAALREDIFFRNYIGFDATGIKLQVKGQGKLHPAQMWVARAGPNTGPEHVYYKFTLTKESFEVVNLLDGFQGYAQADAASNHDKAMNVPGVIEVGCWAHAARRFKEAVGQHPEEGGRILKWIRALYDIEDRAKDVPVAQRLAMRRDMSTPIMKELFCHFEKIYKTGKALPQSNLGQAIAYCLNQKKPLHRYLEDGRILIDNNRTEHALRPFGIGRKNWMFAGSERGGQAAAVFLSLFMSCRALGINPWVYLKDVLDRIHRTTDLKELLPGYWKPLEANTQLGVPVYIKTEEPKTIDV